MRERLLVLFSALLLVATPAGATGRTVVQAGAGDIKDWDPAIAFSLEVPMLVNVYEPLLWYNPPGSAEPFTPALATSWSSSEGGTVWTFKLRPGVRFHDGTPLTADAAKRSLERTIALKQGAFYIWDPVAAIEAPDDGTLVIRTTRPAPIDLIASSQYGAYIYSLAAAAQGTDWFNQGHDAGTGPYRVRQWDRGQQTVLERFPDYWGGWQDRNFSRVILKTVLESATQIQLLRTGDADIVAPVPADAILGLTRNPKIRVAQAPSWNNTQFLINTAKPPTDNLAFRQALSHLWDYNTVAETVYAGSAEPAAGPIPRSMWGHDDTIETPRFDPALARQLLDQSGIPAEARHLTLAYIGADEEYKNAALLFQQNAARLGITVELLPGPWGTIWDKAKKLETAPNLQSMTWWPTYATPSDWLVGLFRTEQPTLFNLSHYSNPAFDAVVNEGVALEGSDRPAAIAKYGEAQQILMADAPAIFAADLRTRVGYRADIQGLEANPAYAAVFYYRLWRSAATE